MNAKEEFLNTTKDVTVIAASIEKLSYFHDDKNFYKLKLLYNQKDYNIFLKSLDFEYDDGYGSQNLSGIIFCENNIWFERGEYDGSEWWEKHKYPNLKDYFSKKDILKYKRYKKINEIRNNI